MGLYCVAALYLYYVGSGFYAFHGEVPLGGFIYFLSQGVIDFRLYVLAAFDDDVAVVVSYVQFFRYFNVGDGYVLLAYLQFEAVGVLAACNFDGVGVALVHNDFFFIVD